MELLRRKAAGAILAAGVILGGLGTAALIHGPAKAEAQAEAKHAIPGRYQVSSFAYGYGYTGPGTTNSQSKWGAYLVDTQTGETFLSIEGASLRSIGKTPEK